VKLSALGPFTYEEGQPLGSNYYQMVMTLKVPVVIRAESPREAKRIACEHAAEYPEEFVTLDRSARISVRFDGMRTLRKRPNRYFTEYEDLPGRTAKVKRARRIPKAQRVSVSFAAEA